MLELCDASTMAHFPPPVMFYLASMLLLILLTTVANAAASVAVVSINERCNAPVITIDRFTPHAWMHRLAIFMHGTPTDA